MANRGAAALDRPTPDPPPEDEAGRTVVAAFNALRDELVSTLAYLLGNRDDALDMAQETFLKCWRSRAAAAGIENLRAWIFRVGLNSAKDLQRSAWNRRMKSSLAEDTMTATETPPAKGLEDRETLDRLREAIAGLRRDEKEVFLLRQNGELTYEQIAEIRGIPVGTIKTQMRAALTKLRKVLVPAETA